LLAQLLRHCWLAWFGWLLITTFLAISFLSVVQDEVDCMDCDLFSGLSMVSDLRFYSGKDINLKNSVPFVVILLIVLAFVLISYSPPEVLFFVALVYGLSGYALWLIQYSKRETSTSEQLEN